MRKKQTYLFVFISLLVYTFSVFGITINKHFCDGELESVSLVKQDSCCGGEMEEGDSDGCCANETIYLSNISESINQTVKITVDPFLLLCQEVITNLNFNFLPQTYNVAACTRGKPPAALHHHLSYLMVFRI